MVDIVFNCSVFVIHRQHKCIFWSFLGLVQVVLSDFITKNNRYMRICCSLFPFCLLNDFRVNATLGPGRKGIMTRSCKFCNSYFIAVSHNLVEIVLNCSVFVIHRQHKCIFWSFLGLVQVVLSDFITKNNRYMSICCSLFPFCARCIKVFQRKDVRHKTL